MSSAERFVRHHKQQTDRAISQAYARLAAKTLASRDIPRAAALRSKSSPAVAGRAGRQWPPSWCGGARQSVPVRERTRPDSDGLAGDIGVLAASGVFSCTASGLHVRRAAVSHGVLVCDR